MIYVYLILVKTGETQKLQSGTLVEKIGFYFISQSSTFVLVPDSFMPCPDSI